ncbi:MAG: hypothetical protein JJ863_21770 [Deltaproteobacteria bacterium]|nr:hypothetical protein [Deltaproteobacteria bacterium]
MTPTKAAALLVLAMAATAAPAEAQYTYSDAYDRNASSPETFAFEIRVGGYRPDGTNGFDEAFQRNFGDEIGPMVGLELDVLPFRIPYVGMVGLGLRFDWAKYTGKARSTTGMGNVDQSQEFRVFGLPLLAVLRVDVLARELNIPVVFTGKLGLHTVFTLIDNGSRREHSGVSNGLSWGAQVALELDFINPRRAANLDNEWGINHTALLFELFGNTAGIGGANIAWTAGLGMTF